MKRHAVLDVVNEDLDMLNLLPYSIFRRSNRPYYFVSFKNEITGKYLPAISTEQATKTAALKTVLQWLRTGIPQKGDTVISLKLLTLRTLFKESEMTQEDAAFFIEDLKQLKSAVFIGSKQDRDLGQFLEDCFLVRMLNELFLHRRLPSPCFKNMD